MKIFGIELTEFLNTNLTVKGVVVLIVGTLLAKNAPGSEEHAASIVDWLGQGMQLLGAVMTGFGRGRRGNPPPTVDA